MTYHRHTEDEHENHMEMRMTVLTARNVPNMVTMGLVKRKRIGLVIARDRRALGSVGGVLSIAIGDPESVSASLAATSLLACLRRKITGS